MSCFETERITRVNGDVSPRAWTWSCLQIPKWWLSAAIRLDITLPPTQRWKGYFGAISQRTWLTMTYIAMDEWILQWWTFWQSLHWWLWWYWWWWFLRWGWWWWCSLSWQWWWGQPIITAVRFDFWSADSAWLRPQQGLATRRRSFDADTPSIFTLHVVPFLWACVAQFVQCDHC